MENKDVKWGAVFLILLVVNGCALLAERKPEEVVRQRSMDRWSALVDGKLETAYTYESPEYRELYAFSDFRKKIRGVGVWKKVDIENVECKDESCNVTTRIYIEMKAGMGFGNVKTDGPATEHWMRHTTGQWYHVSDQ